MPSVRTYSRPADMSLVRLSTGIGSSLALLNANDIPNGWLPPFLVEAKVASMPNSREMS